MRAVRDICSWTTKQLSIKHSDALARRLPTETAPLRTPTVPPVPTRMRSQITLPARVVLHTTQLHHCRPAG
jgi:hypothetical protein